MPPALRKSLVSFVAAVAFVSALVSQAHAAVILSELCDPQNNFQTDRFIEIFNTGPGAVDLTGWSVVAIANSADVTTWPLSGTIPAGTALVCGNNTTVTGFTVNFQNAQWGASGYFNWNGRVGDGAKLVNASAQIVDQVVAPGILFENADLVRVASVSTGSASYVAAEWTATPVLLATNASPGTHNGSAPPPPGPRISNILTSPATPVAATPTDVQADVVDDNGPLTSVTLRWGSTAGSLTNSIAMAIAVDSTYLTTAQIPGVAAGASIFYRVDAVGSVSSSQSPVQSYTIAGGGGGTGTPPTISAVGQTSDSTLRVFFSEPLNEASAETPGSYTVGALVAVNAVLDNAHPSQVEITVRNMPAGTLTLTANNIQDAAGDVGFGISRSFTYIDVSIPPGYYNGTAGLKGSALRKQLHLIIRNHTVRSYAFALTAFGTSDLKANGKIWDMYSDIPDGTPAYEYAFGQTGQGAGEGFGYNREHSWPQSWFNSASPMDSDLWILYPTDSYVNGTRSNFPYGVVGTSTKTSTNGSKLGNSVSPGYGGTVFEPIDPYKGDLARGQFYVATRYFGQDGGWAGSPSAVGANIVPWAAQQYMQWSQNDPVSWKERLRNGAVYVHQGNRNPFVDHPEFVTAIWDSNAVVGVGPDAGRPRLNLASNPSPFVSRTTVAFQLPREGAVTVRVFDVTGRVVRTLADAQTMTAGVHQLEWDGRGEQGAITESGLYFVRVNAGEATETRRIIKMR